jgi:hypothetical protein
MRFHSHFVEVRYTTRDPFKGVLFILIHLCIFCLTIATHPTYVFFLLANDTHIVGLASNAVLVFLHL